ncbi:MAG: hypothetical protein NVS9B10_28270 [Nevskia sp.]
MSRGCRHLASAGIGLLGLIASAAWAGPTGEPEPALRALMSEAIKDADSFDDKYLAEVWLTDMSARLQRYVPKAMPDAATRLRFLKRVHAEATRAKVSPELVMAVIDVESRFERLAISSTGALGYMQIMPFWIEEIGQKGDNLFHGDTNLRMGCTILKYYLEREKGSYLRGLARYNGSTGKLDYPFLVLQKLNQRWSR